MPQFSRPVRLFFVLTLLLVASSTWADLKGEVTRAIDSGKLKDAVVSVCIRDANTDTVLVKLRETEPMIPASNMKLLTTGAALHVLGPDFRFDTSLHRAGDRLVLVGDGDPGLGDPELLELMVHDGATGIDVETFLKLWTDPVKDAGMDSVSELIIDARIFDDHRIHPTWPTDQLNRRYCAEVAGLNFHLNVLHFFPRPVKNQAPDLGRFTPYLSEFSPKNRGTSRTRTHDKNTAWLARRAGTNDLTFYGNVKFAYKAPVPVTVDDAPTWFGHLIANRLKASGVSVTRVRDAGPDDPRFEGKVLRRIVTPITTAITRCNRDSQNLYAEALLKRIGYETTRMPGSWDNGCAIVRHVALQRLKDSAMVSPLEAADGSGLSRNNRVTASLMTAWLNSFHRDEELGPAFVGSMAVAGRSGTLAKRFGATELYGATVHAKSGYINEVSCLSGFVTMPDGRRRSFSVLVNNLTHPGSVRHAKRLQEQIVSAIAADMARVTTALGSD